MDINQTVEQYIDSLLPKFHNKHHEMLKSVLTYLDKVSDDILERESKGVRLCEEIIVSINRFFRDPSLMDLRELKSLLDRYHRALTIGF